jgi:hypothetical protein
MSQRIVCEWIERFINGCTSVKHGEGTGYHTVETLKKLNFEVLEHPLYSLDFTPSDAPVWSI